MDVKVNQVWEDNDRRVKGRRFRVDRIDCGLVFVTVIENPEAPETVGRVRRIRLDRFRPTSTGYRLVSEAKSDV